MQDGIAVHQEADPADSQALPVASSSSLSPGALAVAPDGDSKQGIIGSGEGSVHEDEGASKAKKPRLPRFVAFLSPLIRFVGDVALSLETKSLC